MTLSKWPSRPKSELLGWFRPSVANRVYAAVESRTGQNRQAENELELFCAFGKDWTSLLITFNIFSKRATCFASSQTAPASNGWSSDAG